MPAWLLRPRTGGLLLLGVVIGLAPLLFPSAFYYRIAALIFITGLAVIGLNILMGFAGQVSLGHAGFFGIGAYTVAVGPGHLGISPWAALGCALLLVPGLAWLIGRPILKLRGHYLAIATLGFGFLVAMVLNNEIAWTGGPDGMPVERLSLFGYQLAGARGWYWASGAILLLGAWVALNLDESPTGRALRALSGSEVAASINGIDVARYKLLAFVLSAVYASVAGAMLALFNGFVTPRTADVLHSIELVTMVVVGGAGSVFGGIAGAAILTALPQVLTVFHEFEQLFLGFIMMAAMILLREGVVPALLRLMRPSE
jgi:branched-chain amino acid transport system permease protein